MNWAGAAGGGAIVNDEFTRVEAAQEERAAVAADFDAIEQIEVERMEREQAQDDGEDEEKGQSQQLDTLILLRLCRQLPFR